MMERKTIAEGPARLLVTRISALMEDLHEGNRDLVAAFRRAPSTTTFDRAMAFRTCPMHEEFRAAVGRLENGSYGRCMLCGELIGTAELLEFPLGRYCRRCGERPAPGKDQYCPGRSPSAIARSVLEDR